MVELELKGRKKDITRVEGERKKRRERNTNNKTKQNNAKIEK